MPVPRFEFFVETNAFGTGLGVPSIETMENIIDTADRQLEVNGQLKAFCRYSKPQFVPVARMSDDGWKSFLDGRLGHSNWSRWFGVNSGIRYNVVYWEQ